MCVAMPLMAFNPGIGYSVSQEVIRYGTSNVAKFVSFPTGTFQLVHPVNGTVYCYPTVLWSHHSFISPSMVSLLVQDNSSLNKIYLP